ncbi:hypothetical protein IQ231_02395 [Cuspidothrix issatschenkoi LEGE 03284]|uniref:hypothetical protein n=1 Tax=Cuspidothrix issatschenkoi TaxID=230752 RepID=UPI0019FC7CD8|nr:hypothetical protein [Cuspidothrix issatschenkoi]MBE9230571.1 hypothetical protein [Cuspidothrix issatschenkoi LEGE 03284]
MKPFIYMGYGVNKLIFGITGTEEPFNHHYSGMHLNEIQNLPKKLYTKGLSNIFPVPCYIRMI